MSDSSRRASDFEGGPQLAVEEPKDIDYGHPDIPRQDERSLLSRGDGAFFYMSLPSRRTTSSKRPRDEDITVPSPTRTPKRRMYHSPNVQSQSEKMDSDWTGPLVTSFEGDTKERLNQATTQSAEPSAEQGGNLYRARRDKKDLPEQLSDASDPEETQPGGSSHGDENEHGGSGAVGTDDDELADLFDSLKVDTEVEITQFGGQFDGPSVKNIQYVWDE
jgi:hypothetical protein